MNPKNCRRKTLFFYYFIAGLLLFFTGISAFAENGNNGNTEKKNKTLMLNNSDAKDISDKIGFYTEHTEAITGGRALTPEKLFSFPYTQFRYYEDKKPTLGYSSQVHWARMNVVNNTDEQEWVVVFKTLDLADITMYVPEKDTSGNNIQLNSSRSSFKEHAGNRDVRSRYLAFSVEVPTGKKASLGFRITGENSLLLPVEIMSKEQFSHFYYKDKMLYVLLLGIIAALALYHLIVFFFLGDKNFLLYVLYIIPYTLYIMNLHSIDSELLWPIFPDAVYSFLGPMVFSPLTGGIALAVAVLFTKSFFNTKTLNMTIHRIVNGLVAGGVLLAGMGLILPYYRVVSLFGNIIAVVTVSSIAVLSMYFYIGKRYVPGIYFFTAHFFVILGVFLHSLSALDVLPSTVFTQNVNLYSLVAEGLLLSIAVAYRITLTKSEEEQQRKTAIASLKEADKVKNEFIANTSHELRTPLNGIIGLADSLLEDYGEEIPDEARADLEMIVSSSTRLSDLVNDILDVSRLKSRNLELSFRPVEINKLSEITVSLMKPVAEEKGLTINNEVTDNVPLLYADEIRVQQILFNLLGNAIKFTQEGSITVSSEGRSEDGELWLLSVSDTGIGISEEKKDRIFKPFEQADGSIGRTYGGTGIGLSIAKQLTELHGGTIWVDSILGSGTKFYISLPLFDEKKHGKQEIRMQPKKSPPVRQIPVLNEEKALPEQSQKGKKDFSILVVEDDPVNMDVIRNILFREGYHIRECTNGKDVQSYLDTSVPDLVLLDIMMPEISGYKVLNELRKQYSMFDLPIMMITARNNIEDIVKAFSSGANDYISKPFDRNELVARIRTLERLKRLNRQLKEEMKERRIAEEEREKLQKRLENSLTKVISGFIPICANCKKVRGESGDWANIETYLNKRTEAQLSHGLCPECLKKLYPDYFPEDE